MQQCCKKKSIFGLLNHKLNTMKSKFYLALLTIFAAFLLSGCDPDDPVIPNEEELITTLTYTLAQVDGLDVVLSFVDLDGDGGDAPTIIGGTLEANSVYTGTISLLNSTVTPPEDIGAEVAEEDDEHQFFFASSISDLSVTYNDEDGNGNPVGLETTITTGEPGSGTLTVTLRHEPAKDAAGVADGDIANAGGETDIEVTFDIEVI